MKSVAVAPVGAAVAAYNVNVPAWSNLNSTVLLLSAVTLKTPSTASLVTSADVESTVVVATLAPDFTNHT